MSFMLTMPTRRYLYNSFSGLVKFIDDTPYSYAVILFMPI